MGESTSRFVEGAVRKRSESDESSESALAATSLGVVVPNLNHKQGLSATLGCLQRQELRFDEVLVADGGSTDGSDRVIAEHAEMLTQSWSEPDGGQYFAIDRGLRSLSAEVIGWINSGDEYFPWTARFVVEIFATFPEVRWITGLPALREHGGITQVGCRAAVLRDVGFDTSAVAAGRAGPPWTDRYLQQESTFWRRSLYEEVGGLNLNYRMAGDFELWTRFAQCSPLYRVEALLGAFTLHGDNRSIVERQSYEEEVAKCRLDLSGRLPRVGRVPTRLRKAGRLLRDLQSGLTSMPRADHTIRWCSMTGEWKRAA